MQFHEQGPQTGPVVLCLHGMMVHWSTMAHQLEPFCAGRRVIFAAMDGFYEGSGPFTDFADQAAQIEAYVQAHHGGRLRGIYGVSQGGLLAVELLTRGRIRVDTAVLDSVYVAHQGRMAGRTTAWMLQYFKAHREHPPKVMDVSLSLMGYGPEEHEWFYQQLRQALYWDASDESIRRNSMANYTYRARLALRHSPTRVHLWCGSKEGFALRSHRMLKPLLRHWDETIFADCGHGEFAAKHPKAFLRKLDEAFGAGRP